MVKRAAIIFFVSVVLCVCRACDHVTFDVDPYVWKPVYVLMQYIYFTFYYFRIKCVCKM